mgnify:CR=1 FL=1
MFEGIGIQTILATFTTIGIGVTTPADCYVGLTGRTPSNTFKIADPAGALGCQYDLGNTRIFAEHISSPAKSNDWPGINHAGVKQLLVRDHYFNAYVGISAAIPSKQLRGSTVLSQIGAELGEDMIKFYGEYIFSVNKPEDGMLMGGIKFIF